MKSFYQKTVIFQPTSEGPLNPASPTPGAELENQKSDMHRALTLTFPTWLFDMDAPPKHEPNEKFSSKYSDFSSHIARRISR
jgi:hypothetical protein